MAARPRLRAGMRGKSGLHGGTVTTTTAFNVTFEFSEAVAGFVLADIDVTNGSASNFVGIDGNTYTADITPSGAGNVTINVGAAVVQDSAGNDNAAAIPVTVTYDNTVPGVTILGAPAIVTTTTAFNVTFDH